MAQPNKTTRELNEETRFYVLQACRQEAERLGGDDSTIDYFFQRAIGSRVDQDENGAIKVADMPLKDWCSAILWRTPGLPNKTPTHSILDKLQALTKVKSAHTDQFEASTDQSSQLFRPAPCTQPMPTADEQNPKPNASGPLASVAKVSKWQLLASSEDEQSEADQDDPGATASSATKPDDLQPNEPEEENAYAAEEKPQPLRKPLGSLSISLRRRRRRRR